MGQFGPEVEVWTTSMLECLVPCWSVWLRLGGRCFAFGLVVWQCFGHGAIGKCEWVWSVVWLVAALGASRDPFQLQQCRQQARQSCESDGAERLLHCEWKDEGSGGSHLYPHASLLRCATRECMYPYLNECRVV